MSDREKRPEKQAENRDYRGQFKPGQTGNPGGRPVGSVSLVAALKRHLREDPKRVDELVSAWFKQALDGDTAMAKVFLDRVDGPVQQQVDVTSGGDKVQITFGLPVVVEEESEA